MRFENRVLEEWMEEKVTSYFLCARSAREVVPVCYEKNYLDVIVNWHNGEKWFTRCLPCFEGDANRPSIKAAVDMRRTAILLKAIPVLAYVSESMVEVAWMGGETEASEWEEAA